MPFGIAQIGKAFRNEINPRNFTFRSREFEQMELEFFVKPGTDAHWHQYWVDERLKWYESIGLPKEKLSVYEYKKDELAHYASACVDVMFEFPFGRQELEGIAARGDFDLRQHQQYSAARTWNISIRNLPRPPRPRLQPTVTSRTLSSRPRAWTASRWP